MCSCINNNVLYIKYHEVLKTIILNLFTGDKSNILGVHIIILCTVLFFWIFIVIFGWRKYGNKLIYSSTSSSSIPLWWVLLTMSESPLQFCQLVCNLVTVWRLLLPDGMQIAEIHTVTVFSLVWLFGLNCTNT